jgi:hypothetical protein
MGPTAALPDRAEDIRRGLLAGAAVLALVLPPARPLHPSTAASAFDALTSDSRVPAFGSEAVSRDVRRVVGWIAAAHDNGASAFVVVDKKAARVHIFDARARLLDSSAVLLGAARGDDSVPGIGERPIDDVQPAERTTPAGRFVAERGHDARGEGVVWVDYAAAVSMHRVLTIHPQERRLQRLASPSIDDKRISYGCINVPVAFFEQRIAPLFARHRALVYVLPEVKTVQQVFAALDPRRSMGTLTHQALAHAQTTGAPR